MAVTLTDLGMLLLAILLPPLCVFLEKERLDTDVLLNILLTILGWLPGTTACLCTCIMQDTVQVLLSVGV